MVTGADDHVVENRDSAQLANLAEAPGEVDVLLRWIRVPARMIVHENHGRGPDFDEGAEDVAGVDFDAGEAAAADHRVEKDAVADVECDGPEFLDGESGEPGAHVKPDVRGAGEMPAELGALADAEAGELEGGSDKPGSGAGDGCGQEIWFGGVRQAFEATQVRQHLGGALGGHAQDVGDEPGGRVGNGAG
jgi:hypothetical protein